MNYRETIAWLGLEPRLVVKTIASKQGISASSIDLGAECGLQEAMMIAEAYPNHDRIIIIRMKPNEGKPRVNILGKWDARMQGIASSCVQVAATLYYRALRQGKDSITFRTMPTPEEIIEARKQDEIRKLELAAQRSVTVSDAEVADEPEPSQAEITAPGVISPDEAVLNNLTPEE